MKFLDNFKISAPHIKIIAVSMLAGAGLTTVLMSFKLNIFEAGLYDLRVRSRGQTTRPIHTALVAIDDHTLESIGEQAPYSLQTHAAVLNRLIDFKAKAVAFILDYNRAGALEGKENFIAALNRARQNGIKIFLGTSYDLTGESPVPKEMSQLPRGLAIIHKDGTDFAEDKITRRALYSVNGELSLHALIARELTEKTAMPRGLMPIDEVNAHFFLINYRGSTKEEARIFPEVSMALLLTDHNQAELNSLLKDRVVLVGQKSESNSNDYAYTPYARQLFTNPKLHIHGHILETLLHNDALVTPPKWINWFITYSLTAFIVWVVFNTTPIFGVLITALIGMSYLISSMIFFKVLDISLNTAHPLVGVFFAYYVFVPYRLIMEFKIRAELSKKNDVLVQVGELKRNFMSLITHDLKTPVARIQGMGEMLGRAGADKTMVHEIIKSSEELNRFISSILELSKVENQGIKTNFQNKDINRIIEDCVKNHSFEAQARGIELDCRLEPLFPIPVDVNLVGKILSNLIDNAIKYSPAGSSIIVTSKESEQKKGFIEITVADNGFGIAEKDMERLFDKFYRPTGDQRMQVKGYGLGLYLSRYFAELHSGYLEAESTVGKGSSFTLYLPSDEIMISKNTKQDSVGGMYA
jgi:signal transduction histidine kinase